jgi:hypothetical protein
VIGDPDIGPATFQFFVSRLKTDGTPDTTFATGGTKLIATAINASPDIQLTSDGKIVFATGSKLIRLTSKGKYDTSFGGGDGVADYTSGDKDAFLTLRPDGKIVQTPGYDSSTKYLYMPGEKFPEVFDEKATQENAKWAFKFLSECFEDFPYVSDAHRAVPIAAVLTLVARPAILGSIPAVLFDASTRGSGKTLQTDAIATIATGRGAPRMNYTSDDVELEKILAGYALRGSSFICLDNIPSMRPFGGGPMDRVITARDDVELRILGATKIVTLPWRALIMATGNNIGFHGDTSRRVLMARLEPTEEKPEQRTKFKHEDLLGWIRGQRPRLVSAALLILRAYFRAGCPNMGCTRWGSFRRVPLPSLRACQSHISSAIWPIMV